MPILFLIRHGENDYLAQNKLPGRLPGIQLNERGHAQADELCRTLSSLPIKSIYSSPLERAVETASPLAHAKKLGIRIMPDLADTDVGDWEGRSWKSLRRLKAWKVIQKVPSQFHFPGGESFTDAQKRILAVLESIIAGHGKDDMIAIFFHGDPIKLALVHYLGMPLDNFQRLMVHTGSVTILKVDAKSNRVLAVNLLPPFSFPKT